MAAGAMETAYVCGPLGMLSKRKQEEVMRFYDAISELHKTVRRSDAFIPCKHDYKACESSSLAQINSFKRSRICSETSVLVIVAVNSAWKNEVEVEMAMEFDVPMIIVHPAEEKVFIPSWMKSNVIRVIPYAIEPEALDILGVEFCNL